MRQAIYNLGGIRPPVTGIGRYALELIRGQYLLRKPVFAVINHTLLSNAELIEEIENSLENPNTDTSARTRTLLGAIPYSRELYRQLDRRRFTKILQANTDTDFFEHDINYANPSAPVTTVYDLSHITRPECHPRHRTLYLHRYFDELTRQNNKIITISNAIRNELVGHYSVSADRVQVTELAADSAFQTREPSQTSAVLGRYALEHGRYMLSVATFEPRKNLQRVIDAYLKLPKDLQSQCPLVLAGAPGWLSDKLKKQINTLQTKSTNIRYLGYVSQDDLPYIYSGARIFIYPSLYEGFGLPLLEAMQSGCACITSNQGALSEVADTAALKVVPTDLQQIVDAMVCLISDQQARDLVSQQALQRANNFSWQRTNEQTLKIYATL